jgi:hypothetical protein
VGAARLATSVAARFAAPVNVGASLTAQSAGVIRAGPPSRRVDRASPSALGTHTVIITRAEPFLEAGAFDLTAR